MRNCPGRDVAGRCRSARSLSTSFGVPPAEVRAVFILFPAHLHLMQLLEKPSLNNMGSIVVLDPEATGLPVTFCFRPEALCRTTGQAAAPDFWTRPPSSLSAPAVCLNSWGAFVSGYYLLILPLLPCSVLAAFYV